MRRRNGAGSGSIAIALAVVLAAVLAASLVGVVFVAWPAVARGADAPADWPELGGGPNRLAASPGELCPALVPRWAFPVGGAVRAAPIVARGVLFVGGDGGTLWAVDAATGAPRWRFSAATRIRAPALYSDGRAFVGCGDGKVYALNAQTGRILWRFDAGGPVLAAPVMASSTLVVATYPGLILGLDPTSGRLRWRTSAGSDLLDSEMAAYGGQVFLTTSGGRLLALDGDGGDTAWVAGDARPSGAPACAWSAVIAPARAGLFALEATGGAPLWRCEGAPSDGWLGAALGPARVYAAAGDALFALDAATGELLWTAEAPSFSAAGRSDAGGEAFWPGGLRKPRPVPREQVMPPVLAAGVVFWPRGLALLAYDAADGDLLWESELPAACASPAALWSGSLYLGAGDGNVYALSPLRVNAGEGEVAFSDAWPHLVDGYAVAPLREVVVALGGDVAWDGSSATLSLDEKTVRLRLGVAAAEAGGERLDLPVAPFLRNGRLIGPLRPIAGILGLRVDWDPATPAVSLVQP
jgi:outer membrane protein assembly factor BamB